MTELTQMFASVIATGFTVLRGAGKGLGVSLIVLVIARFIWNWIERIVLTDE